MITWDQIYNYLGIRDFIYYISSSQIQDMLFPVKLIFVCFAMFFLAGVIYFTINSSWLQYKFLEDVTEFFLWRPYGMRALSKRFKKIREKLESGIEAEYKLAIIEADDFLAETLDDRGFAEKTFEDSVKKASRGLLPNLDEILAAHETRNAVVYNPDFKIDVESARRVVLAYEAAITNLST